MSFKVLLGKGSAMRIRVLTLHSTCCYFHDTVKVISEVEKECLLGAADFVHLVVGSGTCTYFAHLQGDRSTECANRQVATKTYLHGSAKNVHQIDDFLPENFSDTRRPSGRDDLPPMLNYSKLCQSSIAAYLQWEDYETRFLAAAAEEIQIVNSFISDAQRYASAMMRIIRSLQPTHCIIFNGHYYLERLMLECCRLTGIATIAVESCTFRNFKVISQSGATGNSTDWKVIGLDAARNRILMPNEVEALRGIMSAQFSGSSLIDQPKRGGDFLRQLGLDRNRPTFLYIGQVPHDSTITQDAGLFRSVPNAVAALVALFSSRPEFNLIIRCHPGGAITNLISDHYAEILSKCNFPNNIKVVRGGRRQHIRRNACC